MQLLEGWFIIDAASPCRNSSMPMHIKSFSPVQPTDLDSQPPSGNKSRPHYRLFCLQSYITLYDLGVSPMAVGVCVGQVLVDQ